MSRVLITVGSGEPFVMVGKIKYEGPDENGNLEPCMAIEIRGKVEGVKNSDKTIRFLSPFCSWEVLE